MKPGYRAGLPLVRYGPKMLILYIEAPEHGDLLLQLEGHLEHGPRNCSVIRIYCAPQCGIKDAKSMQFHNPCPMAWTPRHAIKVSDKGTLVSAA